MSDRATHDRLLKAMKAARAAYLECCPDQSEQLTETRSVSWSAKVSKDGKTEFYIGVYSCELDAVDLTPAQLRRLADIKEAGERWERNEGPWPLART
jgi:hypothetical protein